VRTPARFTAECLLVMPQIYRGLSEFPQNWWGSHKSGGIWSIWGISKPIGILSISQVFQILSRYGKTAQI
jgi:sugar phosphate permease